MKKIIIIAAALVVLVGGYLVIKSLGQEATSSDPIKKVINDEGFNIQQGDSRISGSYVAPETLDFGIKIYPNSKPTEDQQSAGNFDVNGVKLTAATYLTTDSRSKVEEYYSNQFGSDAVVGSLVDTNATYKIIKSKTNKGPIVNVWVENENTYFTILKTK